MALACLGAGLLLAGSPAAAKESWYEIQGERKTTAARTGQTIDRIEREEFADPPWAHRPMFGPETERNLLAAIRRYQAIVAEGGWPAIPKGPALAPGMIDERVRVLRQRLLLSGDLPPSARRGYKFKGPMEKAVRRFQLRHGLKPTGRVHASTLRVLNVPADRRLAQLRVNLERVRKIAGQLKGPRYLVVNIPAYELQAIAGGRVQLYSRVITGRPSTRTPVLTASIRAVDFFPTWRVPQSIATRALLPKILKDPDYLSRERIRIFTGSGPGREVDPSTVEWSRSQARRYLFRQDPGPFNALGLVRIDMPNKHIVYMHDTPLQRLFRYSVRAYSAGCVRVQKVLEVAGWLLQRKGWNAAHVRRALASGRSGTVKLDAPVPVHLVYVTAWGSPDGTAQFRLDVYNRDGAGRVVAELEGPKDQISALAP